MGGQSDVGGWSAMVEVACWEEMGGRLRVTRLGI